MIHLDPKKYKWASTDVIDKMLDALNALNFKKNISREEFKQKFPDLYFNAITQIEKKANKKWSQETILSSKDLDEFSTLTYEVFFQKMPLFLFTYNALFFLSLLTSMHNQSTRYPCKCCGGVPKSKYNAETPLIIKFERLIDSFSKAILNYETLHL